MCIRDRSWYWRQTVKTIARFAGAGFRVAPWSTLVAVAAGFLLLKDVYKRQVYATLDRLETKGYVKSHRGEPTPERGGRSKRFFRVTAKGVAAVNRTQGALQSMTEGLDLIRSYSASPSGSSIYSPPPKKQNRSWGTCLRNTPVSLRTQELPSPEAGIGGRL